MGNSQVDNDDREGRTQEQRGDSEIVISEVIESIGGPRSIAMGSNAVGLVIIGLAGFFALFGGGLLMAFSYLVLAGLFGYSFFQMYNRTVSDLLGGVAFAELFFILMGGGTGLANLGPSGGVFLMLVFFVLVPLAGVVSTLWYVKESEQTSGVVSVSW